MTDGIDFFTATCLKWQPLLRDPDRKEIIVDSLKFLVADKRIWLYGFVVMPNHIHLLWCRQDEWLKRNVQQMFMKYTAQKLKFLMIDNRLHEELDTYRSTQSDRQYHFWERRSYAAQMYNRRTAWQKLHYIHNNPVKVGLCKQTEDYFYSSARFYETNQDDWGILTHIDEHLM